MFLGNKYWLLLVLLLVSFETFSQKRKVKKDSIITNKLKEVIVTATKTVRQLSSLPMPITLISKKQIQKSGSVRLKDILLEQTGIIMVSDFGGFKGLQMQGMDAEYTMILIDGVPLIGRSAGNLDLDRITLNNIKQIEIVKGPSSSLYGSEALGGVINIITEQPIKNQLKGNIYSLVKGGAKNELDMNINVLYKKNKLGIVTSINSNSSDGYDLSPKTSGKTTEGYQNFTGNINLTYDFSKKLKALISERYFIQKNALEENKQKDWNFNSKLTHNIAKNWNINYTFYATQYKTKSLFNGENMFFNQMLLRPEIQSQFTFNKNNLIVGIGASFETLKRTSFLRKETLNSQYIFAQYDFNPNEKLNIIVGARYDKHSKYKSAFSPKISFKYQLNNWLAVKSSVGFGFKVPDFRQLFFNFNNSANGYIVLGVQTLHELYGTLPQVKKIANSLKPENSIGYNFGFQIKPNSIVKITINGFKNDIKDMINTVVLNEKLTGLSAGTRVFSYENRNSVYTQGIELETSYKISYNFKFIAGYQLLEAKDKQDIEKIKKGNVYYKNRATSSSKKLQLSDYFGLANRSTHTANAKLFYENKKYNVSANIRAVFRGKYALYDTNNSSGIIDKYDDFVAQNTQINMVITKTFKRLNVQFGINNLFNSRGLENEKNFPNSDTVMLLGRNYYGKIQFNF